METNKVVIETNSEELPKNAIEEFFELIERHTQFVLVPSMTGRPEFKLIKKPEPSKPNPE